MHKRMLALSERLARVPAAQRTEEMHTLLYAAQANDAYWHGLFGGLYLPHLRRAVYASLLGSSACSTGSTPVRRVYVSTSIWTASTNFSCAMPSCRRW